MYANTTGNEEIKEGEEGGAGCDRRPGRGALPDSASSSSEETAEKA